MGANVEKIEILLFIASIVAIIVRRLHIPYSVGLVLAGIGLSLTSFVLPITLTKDLVFNAFLPPLIFEAALAIDWKDLRRDLTVILTLATVGVLIAAGVVMLGMHYLVHWDWNSAALFGILIAATDPVSVIATFKEAGVQGRLRLLVEAESLFNDSTVAVLFGVALTITIGGTTGGGVSAGSVAQTLALNTFGGLLCGLAVGGGMLFLAGRTDDHLIEITFTTIAAYGSFVVAEHFHLSGVLATLTAGILIGNFGTPHFLSGKGREEVESFWEYAAFVVNSLIFILIGVQEVYQGLNAVLEAAIVVLTAVMLVLLGRALAIYLCCWLFIRSALRIAWVHQHILVWGGLRGALALALALSLPLTLPHRDEIIVVAFAVVAFSLFAQGLTFKPLLRRLGQLSPTKAAVP